MPIIAAAPAQKTTTARVDRDEEAVRLQAEQFVLRITRHRLAGRSALLSGDLDTAYAELITARDLEPNLDRLGAVAREVLPRDWEQETDLTPLARALSSRSHPNAGEAWRRVLEARPARSIQAEAAEQLAHSAFHANEPRIAVRRLHAATQLGRHVETHVFLDAYKQAGVDPTAALSLYLTASRLDLHAARANGVRDPLTGQSWPDQDARWWVEPGLATPGAASPDATSDHQQEAFLRARDLARTEREQGWVNLADGDLLATRYGVRSLGRNIRTGAAEAAEHDTFMRIRLAYETAADRLPDVAWPWYRLAELLAWAGFHTPAREHLQQAERRSLGPDGGLRAALRELVDTGLGTTPGSLSSTARPFPKKPFNAPFRWRLSLRPSRS